ncbi:hypothetical protein SAMN05518801_10667 [Novosphingobium sp. CF614]|uniref:hypothetical protein n=1 Tax=Novosphingobium sp. CF614 TaxID=1884364 RepID=UPI0008E0A4C9|nr:hypothetical protein [Novosphingobium sp. CF614]SFG04184.1 hypothetical protein SAMN05518801_10667 [Novosphingobium sp. CF614]
MSALEARTLRSSRVSLGRYDWRGGCLLPFALAACSSQSEPPPVAAGDEHIACAVAGSAQLAPVCSVERSERQGKLTLVVHHPDGAFRRFDVMTDGTGLAVADGAEEGMTRLVGGKLEITVGADRYVFPVTAKKDAIR